MSLRTIPVAAEMLGLVAAGAPDPVLVWSEKDGRRFQTDEQERDDDGQYLWTIPALPTTVEKPEVLPIRTASRQQPVVGLLSPIAVDNLELTIRIDKSGKIAQYWSASDVRDAGQQHRRNGQPEHKEGQPA